MRKQRKIRLKEKEQFKKIIRTLSLPIIISLLLVLLSNISKVTVLGGVVNDQQGVNNEVGTDDFKKSANVEGRDVRIKFNVKGLTEVTSNINPTDIILAINRPGSASSQMAEVVKQTRPFLEKIMKDEDVRVAVVAYGGNMGGSSENDIITTGGATTTNPAFKTNVDDIISEDLSKGALSYFNGQQGGTGSSNNAEKAIEIIGDRLAESKKDRPNSNKIVILLNDCLPNKHNISKDGVGGTDYYDLFIKSAQKQYNKYIGGIYGYGGIADKLKEYLYSAHTVDGNEPLNDAIYERAPFEDSKGAFKNVQFYSVGLFSKIDDYNGDKKEARKMAIEFLASIQNAVNISEPTINDNGKINFTGKYKDDVERYAGVDLETGNPVLESDGKFNGYYTEDGSKLSEIYERIFKEAEEQIISKSLTNCKISDTLSKDFKFPIDSNGNIDKEAMDIQPAAFKDKITIKDKTITIAVGDVGEEGIEVSFKVKSENEYLYGNNIPTNSSAKVTTTNKNGSESIAYEFKESPTVNYEPIEGSIEISKNLSEGSSLIDENDTFNVDIIRNGGNEKYGFTLKYGDYNETKQVVRFYLRDEKTPYYNLDISKYPYNFVNVGSYKVNEIVPLNYEHHNTYINNIEKSDFIIDIDNRDNKVIITNQNNLSQRWYDKDSVENKIKVNSVTR